MREVFVRLWEEGLIYRGHRVIHWCPRCLTALSDEEAEHHETTGALYYIHYPLTDGSGHVTVATTRPETLLGDTAIVVHPDDPRGAPYIGKRVRLPIAGGEIEIPVLADESVDKEFGTGFVKVTPAHDASDFEIGLRHDLAMPLVMRENGTMGDDDGRVPKDLVGLDRFEARKKIVKLLEAQGLLAKTESHQHSVRRCYRCDSIVEPRLSDQWFVKMQPLAEPVLAAYHRGEIRIVPERWQATFLNWMENIRDWNISRQLWWGHRIPVFTCTRCHHQWADREDPAACPKCGGPVEQDPDVLDTWFSSWLWPFATLGWPERTPDLERYYPGHTLVTAPEILFFWVARMLMAGFHFMGKKPFTTVYLTGTVRDTKHRRMSKSLGNGIDPLDVVKLFGADALRWTLIAGGSLGADVILDPEDLATTFAPGRNFANKLWNIARFILAQLPAEVPRLADLDPKRLTLADRWILSRAQNAIAEATAALEQFRLDEAAKRCFEFAWGELADWYVETVKPRLAADDRVVAQAVLAHCWQTVLGLLHPVVPFITEELWQKLPGGGRRPGELLILAPWPTPDPTWVSAEADAQFGAVPPGDHGDPQHPGGVSRAAQGPPRGGDPARGWRGPGDARSRARHDPAPRAARDVDHRRRSAREGGRARRAGGRQRGGGGAGRRHRPDPGVPPAFRRAAAPRQAARRARREARQRKLRGARPGRCRGARTRQAAGVAHPARRPGDQAPRAGVLLTRGGGAARGAVPLAFALAAACANTGPPPGGPPDEKPPIILGVYPESGAVVPNPRGDAVIQFDGVIDEQSGGGGAALAPSPASRRAFCSSLPRAR